jgi:hypothetical protein
LLIEQVSEKEASGNLHILTTVARITLLVACTREELFEVFTAESGSLRVDCSNVFAEFLEIRLDGSRSRPNRLDCLVLRRANTQDAALGAAFLLGRPSQKMCDRRRKWVIDTGLESENQKLWPAELPRSSD